jgi:D-methionine transport system ATP-binding protein
VITVTDVKKVYRQGDREVQALDGVTLTVPEDSVHGVIGQSGAGKSTLVRCIAMLDRPTSGSVTVNGVELTAVRAGELRRARRRLGVVFQHANLFDSRTVEANVAYPLELAGVDRPARAARARDLLAMVGLADAAGAHPAQLSGGQRQRVGIARALATEPDVLLCDEPTSALDPATTGEILDLISGLKERLGIAVLVITHEMGVVKRICDSVSLLEGGRVVESGTLEDAVGRFGGRLSEALLALPPDPPRLGDRPSVEVLEALAPGGVSVLDPAGAALGAHLPVAAGVVERLGGTSFHRSRVLVPDAVPAEAVVGELRRRGASASVSGVPGEAAR